VLIIVNAVLSEDRTFFNEDAEIMSVAFRRESDEEHKEPRFERPLPAGPNLVTARGLALIDEQIATLTAARDAAGSGTGTTTSTGSEDADHIARALRYWQTRHATAALTAAPEDGSVGFGSVVDIVIAGKQRTIAIVGDDEADPKADRLAFTAPLARALIGAEVGDVLPFAGRDEALTVVAVR
jgi:transcription elongation GreA/GreB family factor